MVFEDRSLAEHLLDFYRDKAHRLIELENADRLVDGEMAEFNALEVLFEDAGPEDPATLLGSVYGSETDSTGDPVVDAWEEKLSRGEVPAEFWGPMGPPEGH